MNKLAVTKLGAGVLIAVLVYGCQLAGPSDEELVNATMANWRAAFMAQNLDKLMAAYSEDYVSARGHDKQSVRSFMAKGIEEGFLDNIEVDLENAETTIEGNKARVAPVVMAGRRGPMNLEFTLQKEKGTWRIVSSGR